MFRERDLWKGQLPEWEAEVQSIRQDEPPTLWAIYAICWNQTIERHQLERKGYFRIVKPWQSALRHLVKFRPHDFPAQA
jgi:hypothetical protein